METTVRKYLKLIRRDHHSRDYTRPTTTLPWLLVAGSLPLSIILFYNIILPVVFGLLGVSFPATHPYHIVHDIWLKLVCPCPILIDSQTRHVLQTTATTGSEIRQSTYQDLLTLPVTVHREFVSFEGNRLLRQHDEDNVCAFNNWISNETEYVSGKTSIPGITSASLDLDHPCVAGLLSCDKKVALLQPLDGFDKPRHAVDGIVVVSQAMSLMSVQLHPREASLGIIYIQVNGSILIFCRRITNGNSVEAYSLHPGDVIKINDDDCPGLYVSAEDDISVGITIYVN
ncbi:hypothetical protein LSH36_874g01055 [Paralvinella palmiformis]|uniref:Uncharacterized protein n=1 Tax=Paralvinella palmiformis TaxID=53620 RepID=A0AAD9MT34_9ANNE|nr:hypothetical protein LSH36_874g01055 [Paralvinella palmiformis]